MINVEVKRNGNESVSGLLRRYTRKMQSAGIVRRVRDIRYFKRKVSDTRCKRDALLRLERTAQYIKMYKEGRDIPRKRGHR